MFENLFDEGSLWVILLLEYVSASFYFVREAQMSEHPGARFLMPRWFFSTFARGFAFAGVITALLTVIYIGLFDGFWAAVVGGLIVNFIGLTIGKVMNFQRYITAHFITAALLTPLTVFMFFNALPHHDDLDEYSQSKHTSRIIETEFL